MARKKKSSGTLVTPQKEQPEQTTPQVPQKDISGGQVSSPQIPPTTPKP